MDLRQIVMARVQALLEPAPKSREQRNSPRSSSKGDIDVYLKKAGYKGWSQKEESR